MTIDDRLFAGQAGGADCRERKRACCLFTTDSKPFQQLKLYSLKILSRLLKGLARPFLCVYIDPLFILVQDAGVKWYADLPAGNF